MNGSELIGWFSSIVLVVTIAQQVHKQWKDHTSAGVSRWLFVGQFTASLGFTVYSALVHNWVFVVTNSLMLCNAVLGLAVVVHHRRRARNRQLNQAGSRAAPSGSQRAIVG